jgi:hypothetical protein
MHPVSIFHKYKTPLKCPCEQPYRYYGKSSSLPRNMSSIQNMLDKHRIIFIAFYGLDMLFEPHFTTSTSLSYVF